ncbi:MAG: hypothetical protein JWM56_1373 [Candidatus Peribacteria bacterium]|nr:hypothetical protein [Candidatus Peribacteria bacterium]
MLIPIPTLAFSPGKTFLVLSVILLMLILDIRGRLRHRKHHYMFAAVLGTLLSLGMIQFGTLLIARGTAGSAMVGLGVVCMVILWRLLFGAWDVPMKATVLGVFILWMGMHILWTEPSSARLAHVLTIIIAAIPALVWSSLFLKYHRERLGHVMLMFFAGILSTVPILFYDALQRHGATLQFFLFTLQPDNFNDKVDLAVRTQLPFLGSLQVQLASMFAGFLVIAIMEEGSKFWVLHATGKRMFRSIDDVMQLAIMAAIGFAFAENIINQGYFLGFVNEYLRSKTVDWGGFLGNVAGRSVLTIMVHIVSTGIMGYFYGLALYAGPYLQEARQHGKTFHVARFIHVLSGIPLKTAFRICTFTTGMTAAILLHATANFLVSLPESLPGNPRTLGDLVGAAPGSPLHLIALLLIPSLLYVGGGFWLLSYLFTRKENMKERGEMISVETFVSRKVME